MDGKLYEGIIKVKSQKAKTDNKAENNADGWDWRQRSMALIFLFRRKTQSGILF